MSAIVDGGVAHQLVASVYGAHGLFASEADMVGWARQLRADRPADQMLPGHFAAATRAALMSYLNDAGVVSESGTVDEHRLRDFQQLCALLPHIRLEEQARIPAPRPKVVFTVPPGVTLPGHAAHLKLSLAQRVFDALVSATTRTLLASPYWSDEGAEQLMASLQTTIDLGLPITLAGAKHDPDRDDLPAMLRLASRLKDAGCPVTALRFDPPTRYGIFHAKLVCGTVGYLGSANLTKAGLGTHVEAGLPLDEPDVEQVWWLLYVLADAGLLVVADLP